MTIVLASSAGALALACLLLARLVRLHQPRRYVPALGSHRRRPRRADARGLAMPRPSIHYNPITKSYAIDQIEDIERLRAVAHHMWEAFFAAHSQAAHAISAAMRGDCQPCAALIDGDVGEPCEEWKVWQRLVNAGFGSV